MSALMAQNETLTAEKEALTARLQNLTSEKEGQMESLQSLRLEYGSLQQKYEAKVDECYQLGDQIRNGRTASSPAPVLEQLRREVNDLVKRYASSRHALFVRVLTLASVPVHRYHPDRQAGPCKECRVKFATELGCLRQTLR